VHVFDSEGKLVAKWPVGFNGQAINTAPDGNILVGGDGRVARFDPDGKKLRESESPQMTYIKANPDEMRQRAKDQRDSDIATYSEQVKQFEDQLKEMLEAKGKAEEKKEDSDEPTKEDATEAEADPEVFTEARLKVYIQAYKQMLERIEKQTVEDVLKQVIARASRTHSIAASEDEVFVSCPAMAGYGYGVWRTNPEFGEAKEIIKSLSGCCGQMDVQCHNGELFVCENSRHRVVRFDREGKQIAAFGKRDRTGEGENFGGCCNPMNLCFAKNGNLVVSESNGVVKQFSPGGDYLGLVGIAKVQPGCKNSCVGLAANDDQLFYIDIEKSQIILLTRDEPAATASK
jgi:hypothetical protein